MVGKIVSKMILMILLACILTLTISVAGARALPQLVNSVQNAEVLESKEVLVGRSRITMHKVEPFELERLKITLGTFVNSMNYTQIIDGHGTGLAPPTKDEWAKIAQYVNVVDKITLDASPYQSNVDQTTKPWFPPIGDQGSEGSCTAWAVGYYIKTFQEAKEHRWDLSRAVWENGQPSVDYQDRIISPDFVYHLINGGVDAGSSSFEAINLICSIGASSWEKMPYNENDHTSWPVEEAWREAPLYRGYGGWQYMWVDDDEGLANLKNWIASDNLAKISVDSHKYSQMTSNDVWTLDNYVSPATNHANTIVGYDDNFAYNEQGQIRYGAFKVANSWGIGQWLLNPWENVYDGCYWISYEAMKQQIRSCEFFFDRIGYNPELVASFRMTHTKRGECDIAVGVGSQTKSFNQYVDGGNQPFCSNDVLFDITEFKDTVPNPYGQQFYLRVYDGGSNVTGTLSKFAVEHVKSTNVPTSTIDGKYVYAYVTLSPLETNWTIARQVCSDNDFLDSVVSMETDSNGYLYVTYDDWNNATNQYAVFVRRSIDGGQTWQTIATASDPSHNIRYPSMAIDPLTNNIFIAVEREWTRNDHDILVFRCLSNAWSWSPVASNIGSDDRFPSITSEYQFGQNSQYISYEYVYTYNDRDLMFAKSTNNGTTWTVKKLHGNWPDYNVHAQTSITNGDGNIYIAYKWGADYNSACEIRIDRSTDFGITWAQSADIDGLSNNCAYPSIAAAHGSSTVVVAFQYDRSLNNKDVCYSYSANKGVNWAKGYSLFGSGMENEKSPMLAVDGEGGTRNDVVGCFHAVAKIGSYIGYAKANCSSPDSWSSPVLVNDKWVGKGLSIASQFRSKTEEFLPCIAWTDERTNDIYFSAPGQSTFSDGFESGTFSIWSSTSASTGEAATVTTARFHHGRYSARFTSNGGGGYERAYCSKTMNAQSELFARGYFYVSQSGIAHESDRFFFVIFSAGTSNVAYAGWKRTGGIVKWCLTSRSGTTYVDAYSSASPLLNNWYCVELHWKKGATNGLVELWVNDVKVCSSTGKNTAAYGDVNSVRFGLAELYGCANTTVYCDCAIIATTYIGPEPTITVTSPNGGEKWVKGTAHTITWTSSGSPGANVKIELLKAGVVNTIISSSTANDGSYSWAIPSTQTLGTDYKIRVTSTSNSAYTDSSNNNFAITAGALTVTVPNGGENWARGTTHTITWTSTGSPGGYVKIELLKAGAVNRVISSSTANDGSYSWTIPSTQTVGTDYKIRITSTSITSITDSSNSNFAIS